MVLYDVLDNIADSYIPILAVIWLIFVGYTLFKRQWPKSLLLTMYGIGALLIAYGFMWLDNTYKLWPKIGLDYSTHTAVSFSLAIVLSSLSDKLRIPTMISLFAYLVLMLYQHYHSLADIVTTLAALFIPLAMLAYFFFSISKQLNRASTDTSYSIFL